MNLVTVKSQLYQTITTFTQTQGFSPEPKVKNPHHMHSLKKGIMMLSQENIDKLCMTGVYSASPRDFKLGGVLEKDPWWCRNWTFRPRIYDGEYVMDDTYWSSSPNSISLMDSNFDKFTLLFDLNEVEEYRGKNFYAYDERDRWVVLMGSGGMNHPKYFVRKGAMPRAEKIIAKLREEIYVMEYKLKLKREELERMLKG